ncbi:alpha/beta hydrolase [[Mannheimia] succiniciproducens]|uniref:Aes protein n=1 Tax=Mannheimia succiniciproducens (strain KCTC 0769BP / MBEL55E) TaxID=221988 RepID=Q65QJ2_MANSM|nr:alpha/beta hydrolase [[Mannheimia] succiniciproducens]AAU38768.1 Aes protein [[Mannheimia] succiniciproducens MBEL55E]
MKILLKLTALLLSLGVALNVAADGGKNHPSYPLLASEFRDLSLLESVRFTPEQLQDKAKLTELNAAFLQAAEQSEVQPNEKITAPAQGAQPAVDLYIYRPATAKNEKLPVIYFMHGGGYLFGNARQNNAALAELADLNKAVVISVEYRLASQTPYPADIDDAYHGLAYLFKNGQKLNADTNKVVIMGESAGGGLAARLALKVRDKGEFKLAGQVLIYPMLDYRTGTSQSLYNTPYTGGYVWTAEYNRIGWETLRGGQTIAQAEMPYYSAATATDLAGLPPTYMMVGSLDLFANEDMDYANRLVQAGVPTDLQLVSGVYHAFEIFNPNASQTLAYKLARTNAIQQMLAK